MLAGRDRAQLSALGQTTGLGTLTLPLDDGAALRAALSRVSCVLLAAGPYSLTGPPMRAACLDAGCSYLDINGAIEDFGTALTCDAEARRAGIGIIAGVGYGVVFGECLAAQVALRLPDATWLRLSLATRTAGRSRGATLSVAAALAAGGRDISDGTLRTRAIASSTWFAPNTDSRRTRFAAAPQAELLAVHRSTGIPNIVAGIPLSREGAAFMRVAGPLCSPGSWRGKPLARRAGQSAARRRLTSRGCARASGRRRATPQAGASPPCSKPARAIARPRPPRSARWNCSSTSLALAPSHQCRHLVRNSRCAYRAHASRRCRDHVDEGIARGR